MLGPSHGHSVVAQVQRELTVQMQSTLGKDIVVDIEDLTNEACGVESQHS